MRAFPRFAPFIPLAPFAALALVTVGILSACAGSPTSPAASTGAASSPPGTAGSAVVNVAGSWYTVVVGGSPARVGRKVFFNLTQAAGGALSGTIDNRVQDGLVEQIAGRVTGDSVFLTIGNSCNRCTVETIFSGAVAPGGAPIDGWLQVLALEPVRVVRP